MRAFGPSGREEADRPRVVLAKRQTSLGGARDALDRIDQDPDVRLRVATGTQIDPRPHAQEGGERRGLERGWHLRQEHGEEPEIRMLGSTVERDLQLLVLPAT